MSTPVAQRSFARAGGAAVRVRVGNRSTGYAAHWLRRLGVVEVVTGEEDDARPVAATIVAGGAGEPGAIRLWDFQVGATGTGVHASAVSGVTDVIGIPGRPPQGLPADIPEKWCGAFGAILALASVWRAGAAGEAPVVRATTDVSAADVLRSFALQNAGNHQEVVGGWRRNGLTAVEHGGIFPQGFFRCADGHVAIVGRSRGDWRAIVAALGNPEWSRRDDLQDPFEIARDPAVAEQLLRQALGLYGRDELLRRSLASGATIAPVYTHEEAAERGIFRAGSGTADGPALPFLVSGLR